MTNLERAQEIYFALQEKEFDMDSAGFMAVIAATLDATEEPVSTAAPALFAVLTEPLADSPAESFADDLDTLAGLVGALGWQTTRQAIEAKAQAIRAAIAEVRGE